MSGLNRLSGLGITGMAHLRQSVVDILFTPIGTRLERRDYGSLLPELLDQPDNAAIRVRISSAVAGALMHWEPRIRISRVQLQSGPLAGQSSIVLDGLYVPLAGAAQALSLRLPLQNKAALS